MAKFIKVLNSNALFNVDDIRKIEVIDVPEPPKNTYGVTIDDDMYKQILDDLDYYAKNNSFAPSFIVHARAAYEEWKELKDSASPDDSNHIYTIWIRDEKQPYYITKESYDELISREHLKKDVEGSIPEQIVKPLYDAIKNPKEQDELESLREEVRHIKKNQEDERQRIRIQKIANDFYSYMSYGWV